MLQQLIRQKKNKKKEKKHLKNLIISGGHLPRFVALFGVGQKKAKQRSRFCDHLEYCSVLLRRGWRQYYIVHLGFPLDPGKNKEKAGTPHKLRGKKQAFSRVEEGARICFTWTVDLSLTHSRTHALTHSRTHALMHSCTHHSLTPSLPHSLTPSLPHSLTPSLPHSLTPSLPHSLTPSLPHSLTPSLPHTLTPIGRCSGIRAEWLSTVRAVNRTAYPARLLEACLTRRSRRGRALRTAYAKSKSYSLSLSRTHARPRFSQATCQSKLGISVNGGGFTMDAKKNEPTMSP